jgi:hypothetical protein
MGGYKSIAAVIDVPLINYVQFLMSGLWLVKAIRFILKQPVEADETPQMLQEFSSLHLRHY